MELSNNKGTLARAFKGEERLSIVYWIYFIPFSVLSKLIFAYFNGTSAMPNILWPYIIITILLFTVLYYLLFENLFNVKNEGWSYIALILITLGLSRIWNYKVNGITTLVGLICLTILIALFMGYIISRRKNKLAAYKKSQLKRALTFITLFALVSTVTLVEIFVPKF